MRPLHILFAMFQGSGNIAPILAVARELIERGHRLSVIAGPGRTRDGTLLAVSDAFVRDLAAIGAMRITFDFQRYLPDALPRRRGLLLGYVPRAFADNALLARRFLAADAWARATGSALQGQRAAVVVADFYLVGALAAAEAAGIPSVALVHHQHIRPAAGVPPFGPAWRPATTLLGRLRDAIGNRIVERIYRRDGLGALNKARERLGLPPLPSPLDQYDAAARVLIMTSPAFDFPARALPPNVRHVGMPFSAPQPLECSSPWQAADRRPLVLASFSTAEQGQGPILQRTLTALGAANVRGLVTLGPAQHQNRFERPANVALEPFVPHEAVLPQAAAMVSQCGHGTVMKALACGVPLVCIPLVGDQPGIAARVEHAGAGIRLSPTASCERIRNAIEAVLREPRYRECARRLAARLGMESGAATAAAEIEDAATMVSPA